MEREYDPLHLRAALARTPAERLELAISWNRLAGNLADAGRLARGRPVDRADVAALTDPGIR